MKNSLLDFQSAIDAVFLILMRGEKELSTEHQKILSAHILSVGLSLSQLKKAIDKLVSD